MAARLIDFLTRYAERPFVWGQDDCSLFLADWWMEVHGVDPAASLRGSYDSQETCHKVLFWRGGLVCVVSGLAKTVGAVRTRNPQDGDFAVIRVRNKVVGAIRVGEFWAVRNEQIGFVSDARVLRAWSI